MGSIDCVPADEIVLEKLRKLRELHDRKAVSLDAYRKFEDKILTRYLEL